ncbi:hypothetical protein [uncultured Sphingobacterium sp.]|jgi:hypothetical protein|uniref:hypothetical protein n=1 Tax=uncultured Sphingobacterium sp. TaxID=182688 RepID=UPI003748453C
MKRAIFYHCAQLFFLILILLIGGCSKKENIASKTDEYIDQAEILNPLNLVVSAANKDLIELSWDKVNSSHFKPVSYAIYVDNKLVAKDLSITKYSLINLLGDTNYKIRVIASSQTGRTQEQSIDARTVGGSTTNGSTYVEYKIHTQSRITGNNSIRLLEDGGHLICTFLQHEGGETNFKLIVYRTNNKGQIIWYRLIQDLNYYDLPPHVVLPSKQDEAFIIVKHDIYVIDQTNGKLKLEKPVSIDLSPNDYVSSVQFDASHNMIMGTGGGELLKVTTSDFKVVWKRKNSSVGISSIQLDNAQQIYYSLLDSEATKIKVQKTDRDGNVLATFEFDGKLPGDYERQYHMPILLKDKNDIFYLWGFDFYSYSLRYVKFDKNGNVKAKLGEYVNLKPAGAFFDNDNNIVVYGQQEGGGISTYGTINKYDSDLKLLSTLQYPNLEMHMFKNMTQNVDNSYNLFFYYIQTWSYENLNFIYIKTKSNGQL